MRKEVQQQVERQVCRHIAGELTDREFSDNVLAILLEEFSDYSRAAMKKEIIRSLDEIDRKRREEDASS